MQTIAILVANFPRKGYNFRYILGQKSRYPNKIILFWWTDITTPRWENILKYYTLTFNVKNHLNISEKDKLKSFYSYHMILIIFQITFKKTRNFKWFWEKHYENFTIVATWIPFLCKVQIFWEGHKHFFHLPLFIWHYLVVSSYKRKMVQIFVAFSEYRNFNKHTKKIPVK